MTEVRLSGEPLAFVQGAGRSPGLDPFPLVLQQLVLGSGADRLQKAQRWILPIQVPYWCL